MEKKEYRAIDIPSLIRFVREKEGMTQKEFAETFGFKASSPSMWELGKREAPYKILEFVFSRWLQQELDKAREEGFRNALAEVQKRVGIEDAKTYVLCNAILQESLLVEIDN